MPTKVTLPGSETIEFNLKVENQVKHFSRLETWSPIMAALLLAGVVPTDYWCNSPKQSENSTGSSFLEQFDQLWNGMPEKERKRLRGLDGEIPAPSRRISQARQLLWEWEDKCEDEGKNSSDFTPWEFLEWLEEACWNEEIAFFDRTWLDAFLKPHGPGASKIILPSNIMESFRVVTDIGDESVRHPLSDDIFQAQQQAKSRGKDPYAIQIIFPLLSRILDDRGVIDKSNEEYLAGKTLPVELDDGSLYILKRNSLRVHLGRLKEKHFPPQQ